MFRPEPQGGRRCFLQATPLQFDVLPDSPLNLARIRSLAYIVLVLLMLVIHTDGACFGNPGPMGIGVAAYKSGKPVKEMSEYLGKGTNNIAEYTAVIRALEFAKSERETEVEIRSDSQLIVRQLSGHYKVKSPHLKELKRKIDSLSQGMKIKYKWIPREENSVADGLSKKAVEGAPP